MENEIKTPHCEAGIKTQFYNVLDALGESESNRLSECLEGKGQEKAQPEVPTTGLVDRYMSGPAC